MGLQIARTGTAQDRNLIRRIAAIVFAIADQLIRDTAAVLALGMSLLFSCTIVVFVTIVVSGECLENGAANLWVFIPEIGLLAVVPSVTKC